MSTATIPAIDRRRPAPPAAPPEAPTFALFAADEVGWLEVEAGSRLAADGRPLAPIRPHEATPLARLARDPRLATLAAELGGGLRRLVAIEIGRAGALRHRRLGDTTVFVELGGAVHGQPGLVHTRLEGIASTTLFLAAGFDCAWSQQRTGQDVPEPVGLWPPAAVVAG